MQLPKAKVFIRDIHINQFVFVFYKPTNSYGILKTIRTIENESTSSKIIYKPFVVFNFNNDVLNFRGYTAAGCELKDIKIIGFELNAEDLSYRLDNTSNNQLYRYLETYWYSNVF